MAGSGSAAELVHWPPEPRSALRQAADSRARSKCMPLLNKETMPTSTAWRHLEARHFSPHDNLVVLNGDTPREVGYLTPNAPKKERQEQV